MDALYIILTGSLVAITCGLLGCYLILRKMAMIGDAISHAVLPGIVIAYLISDSRQSVPMLIGAGLLGVLSTVMIELIHKKARLQSDAAIGVTFTFLFAIGIILLSAFAGQTDLDQDCVLYGEIAFVPLYTWTWGSIDMGPVALWILAGVFLMIVLLISLGYKELFLTTFDPAYASAIGISTALWHYLLMGAVSFATVASFEAVGAILVVAFLIAPPATAYLLTDDFKSMMFLTIISGVIAATGGYFLAVAINGSIAGAMSFVAGIEFVIAIFISSRGFSKFSIKQKNDMPANIDFPQALDDQKQ